VRAGNRQDEGATKKCLEAYDTDSSLMVVPLTDLCSGESQKEERIRRVSGEKVSFFFSVLPLKKDPCPCTAPLSSAFVSELLARLAAQKFGLGSCPYSSPS